MLRNLRTFGIAALTSTALLAPAIPTSVTAATLPATGAVRSAASTSSVVHVATYNIAKSTIGKGKFSWSHRRKALVRAVNSASPDVLLVQEANTKLWHGIKHVEDVRNLMASIGYRITSTNYNSCTPGCTRGAHIFYDPKRMALSNLPNDDVTVGMTGLSVIAQTWHSSIQDRGVSWAFLTPIGSSRATMYVSVHLPTQKNAVGEALRVAIAKRLRPWANAIIRASGLAKAELVIGGDFNSYDRRQPAGAQDVVAEAGLIDGYTAPVKVNFHFGSINNAPKIAKYKGFPPRPYYYAKIDPCRIDYIFSTVKPLRHEIVLRLTKSGKFDNAYRASDHNMVLVDLPLA